MLCFDCDSDIPDRSYVCSRCGTQLPTDADWYFKAGMDALGAGEVEMAITLLRDCVEINPCHTNGRYNLGIALCLSGQHDEALVQFVTIAELDPDYPGIYTALGQLALANFKVHMEEAEMQRAAMIHFLTLATEKDTEDVDAHIALANAYLETGDAEKALRCLQRAVSLDSDSPVIYFSLARALKMLGRHKEARAMAKKALLLSPPDAPFAEDLRTLAAQLGQDEPAS